MRPYQKSIKAFLEFAIEDLNDLSVIGSGEESTDRAPRAQ